MGDEEIMSGAHVLVSAEHQPEHCPGCDDPSMYASRGCPGVAKQGSSDENRGAKQVGSAPNASPAPGWHWDGHHFRCDRCDTRAGDSHHETCAFHPLQLSAGLSSSDPPCVHVIEPLWDRVDRIVKAASEWADWLVSSEASRSGPEARLLARVREWRRPLDGTDQFTRVDKREP
jgi:hypothetical protein